MYNFHVKKVITIVLLCVTQITSPNRQHRGFFSKNNVCRHMISYVLLDVNFLDCWYNADVEADVRQLIQNHKYPYEEYTVETEDGYLLTLYRIPYGKNQYTGKTGVPVLLIPGLTCSSAVYVDIGENSLGFYLADLGYDVWLSNHRGSRYSKGHISLSESSVEYNTFSFHEIAKYDTFSNIQFIANKTNRAGEIIGVGHSMGTTILQAFESLHREYASKTMKAIMFMAPEIFFANIKPFTKLLAPLGNAIEAITRILEVTMYGKHDDLVNKLIKTICTFISAGLPLCANAYYLTYGFLSEIIPPEYLPIILNHNPAGASVRTLNHFAQIVANGGHFRQYDYGRNENFKIYNNSIPPDYDVKGTNISVFIVYSESDDVSPEKDVYKLYDTIPEYKRLGLHKVAYRSFSHIDYLYGGDIVQLVYSHIGNMMNNISSTKR